MLFVDRLEIWNPGSLTPALNIKKLKTHHSSFPKNPKLAEALYQAGYIERFGTGTEEIFQLTKEAGLKEPEFDLTGGFTITIWRPKTQQAPDKYRISTAQVAPKYPLSTPQVPLQHRTSTGQVPDKYRTSTGQVPDKSGS
jgi:predicted HTH transcriptional regulator